MPKFYNIPILPHIGSTLGNYLKVLSNGAIKPRYYLKVLLMGLFILIATPFHFWDYIWYLNVPSGTKNAWGKGYIYLMKKAAMDTKGERLIMKKSLKHYEKNTFTVNKNTIGLIDRYLKKFITEWNYNIPEEIIGS